MDIYQIKGDITMKNQPQQKVNFSRFEFLEETLDSMKASLDNLQKVQKEQVELIEIVTKAEKKDWCEDFIKEEKEQLGKLQQQKEELNKRKEHLQNVIVKCNENPDIKDVVEEFMIAFGIFNQ